MTASRQTRGLERRLKSSGFSDYNRQGVEMSQPPVTAEPRSERIVSSGRRPLNGRIMTMIGTSIRPVPAWVAELMTTPPRPKKQ
jgi:hypothetical protein